MCERGEIMKTIMKLSSAEVTQSVFDTLAIVQSKFSYKNGNYANEEGFHNFRQTSLRVYNSDNADVMFRTLMTYMDKHLCTLAKNGFSDTEFLDRFEDVIIYSCLAITMHKSLSNE